MKARSRGSDPAAVDLARRRLGRLGCELGAPAAATSPTGAPAADAPVADRSVEAEGRGDAGRARPRAGRHARERVGRPSLVGGWLADALPSTGPARFGLTAHHVTVVCLVLAAAAVLAAWLLVRSAPQPPSTVARASLSLPEPSPADGAAVLPASPRSPFPTPLAVAAAPSATSPVAPPLGPSSAQSTVVVHVTGKVRRPGVVELPVGSRVVDAVDAAGGARRGVRLTHLNLARLLVDGEQIAVGIASAAQITAPSPLPAAGGTAVPSFAEALININTASTTELEELPGIGPVTAASIIEWRTEHGGFSSVDELLEVSGIGEVTLAEIRDLVTI